MAAAVLPTTRIVRGAASASLAFQAVDANGEPAAPAGTVTVAVTRADGTAVTVGAVSGSGIDERTVSVGAGELDTVDWLTAVWTDNGNVVASTVTEVCGGTIGAVSEIVVAEPALANRSSSELLAARKRVEDLFTSGLRRGLFERFYTERVDGSGSCRLVVSWPNVRSVRFVRVHDGSGSYTSLTSTELAAIPAVDTAILERTDGGIFARGRANIEVGYTFGMRAVPADLRKALFRAIRADVVSTNTGIPDRAISFQPADGGNVVLATPGVGRWITGIPEVDEAIKRYGFFVPGVA